MIPALAATTKMLKAVTSLRFDNRRTLAIAPDATWLAKSKLTPTERRQLVAILGAYDTTPPVTLDRAMTVSPETLFTGGLHAFAGSPVEWFDILDQDNVVQFQLWLYDGGGGILFKAATTTPVAHVVASSFHGGGRGLDEATGERLAAHLRKAKKIAANLHPASALASVSF